MREIKFRAWDKKEKKILDWFFIHGIYQRIDKEKPIGLNIFDGIDERKVIDFELMQFTGLKDKNGKEIYEGDLIKYSAPAIRDEIYTIVWRSTEWQTRFQKKSKSGGLTDIGLNSARGEVIGNIYENPELL